MEPAWYSKTRFQFHVVLKDVWLEWHSKRVFESCTVLKVVLKDVWYSKTRFESHFELVRVALGLGAVQ